MHAPRPPRNPRSHVHTPHPTQSLPAPLHEKKPGPHISPSPTPYPNTCTNEPTHLTPTHLFTYSPTHLPTYPPTHLPTYPPTHLPTYPPTHLPTYPPTHLPTYPPTHLPTYPPTHLPTYPPTHLPTYPPTQLHNGDSRYLSALAPRQTSNTACSAELLDRSLKGWSWKHEAIQDALEVRERAAEIESDSRWHHSCKASPDLRQVVSSQLLAPSLSFEDLPETWAREAVMRSDLIILETAGHWATEAGLLLTLASELVQGPCLLSLGARSQPPRLCSSAAIRGFPARVSRRSQGALYNRCLKGSQKYICELEAN